MRTSAKLVLTTLMAALLLASAVGTASAGRLSTSNLNFRVMWSLLEFSGDNGLDARCQVTLEGSFHSRTINKIARTLIGAITRINIKTESCEGDGDARPGSPPPWHVTYAGFVGTLPSPSTIRLAIQRFQFELIGLFGITCKVGTATDSWANEAILDAASEITNLAPITGSSTANLLEGGSFCPRLVDFVGGVFDGLVRLLGAATRIRITLI